MDIEKFSMDMLRKMFLLIDSRSPIPVRPQVK
jgi:hypothetical protein